MKKKKNDYIDIGVFDYEIMKNIQSIYQKKKCCKERHADLLIIEKECRTQYVLIKTSIDSCMTTHYIVEENIFVAIARKLSVQNKY